MKYVRKEWFHHPSHGYMYIFAMREPEGWHYEIVTALCLNTADVQRSSEAWEAHKSRLHVNGGCGAIAYECHYARDWQRNPDFVPISVHSVPMHIRRDFRAVAGGSIP